MKGTTLKSIKADPTHQTPRHRIWRAIGYSLMGIVVLVAVAIGVIQWTQRHYQATLQPFYDPPAGWAAKPAGTLLRSEPLELGYIKGRTWRILYVSRNIDHQPTVSSGLIFAPRSRGSDRDVIGFSHGTLGLGPQCAPSRTKSVYQGAAWLQDMVAKGWVVAATDYAGLGTSGVSGFLVGQDEAADVWNSIRAAHQLPTGAGNQVVLFGHSQGGHAALWSASLAGVDGSGYHLRGVVASAPAAELVPLISMQWNQVAAWAIGPDVIESWPPTYGVQAKAVVSAVGNRVTANLIQSCVTKAAIVGIIRQHLGQRYFAANPAENNSWHRVLVAQTAPQLPASLPVLIEQGLADDVVLPATTEDLIRRECQGGALLADQFWPGATHMDVVATATNSIVAWIQGRFAGQSAVNTCGNPLPSLGVGGS